MIYSLTGEPIVHSRFALPKALHKAWKQLLAEREETQPQWFLRKVQEDVAASRVGVAVAPVPERNTP